MQRHPGSLADGSFDLLVIGGGCTGAGVALDAAARGLRTALVDKGDFASATSSASSKLVHGGLRYLEHAHLGLVYEALAERRRLLRNAPHLVKPLRFVLPFYRGSRMPAWKGRTGLWLYDLLAGRHNLRRSRGLGARQLQSAIPLLRGRDLVSAAEYYDAQMDDARLCLEVVRTAARMGANVCNYVEVTGFDVSGERFAAVHTRDVFSGETITIRARQVLNATGPWVDGMRRMAGGGGSLVFSPPPSVGEGQGGGDQAQVAPQLATPHPGPPPQGGREKNHAVIADAVSSALEPLLEPTKGVHIIFRGTPYADGGEPLSRETAFTLLHPADGRVFFVLPWQGHTLVGTTDTFSAEPPDALCVTAGEEQYLLDGYNHYFTSPLKRADVRGRFAGLRPLLRSDPAEPSVRSREFRLIEGPHGLLSAAGGKWTTFRSMAEQISDRVCERLGVQAKCRTRNLKLDGTPAVPWEEFERSEPALIAGQFGLELGQARHLVRRYGRRAAEAAAFVAAWPTGREPVVAGEPDLRGEWDYQREHEMAITRADHLLRRSRVGIWHEELFSSEFRVPSSEIISTRSAERGTRN
jgi:glycerol-3-phosphate dehydrogenase